MPFATIAVILVLVIFVLSHFEITTKPGAFGAKLAFLLSGLLLLVAIAKWLNSN